jgi:hypothetical protein
MKTPQRNFTVEFKSGRRRSGPEPTSIWGNTDLKALVRKAERDAPHLFDPAVNRDAHDHPEERRQATGTAPRILESLGSADVQPVEIKDAERETSGPANAAIPPAAEPVLRLQVAACPTEPRKSDRGPSRSAGRRDKAKLPEAHGSAVVKQPLDDLSELEEENQRLRSLLSQRLLQQNRQLRRMLLRFKAD